MVCGDVTVSRSPRTNGYVWSITFNDIQRNNGDVPRMIVDGSSLSSGTGAPSQVHVTEVQKGRRANGGRAEVQTVTLSSSAAVSGFSAYLLVAQVTQIMYLWMLQPVLSKRHSKRFRQ